MQGGEKEVQQAFSPAFFSFQIYSDSLLTIRATLLFVVERERSINPTLKFI